MARHDIGVFKHAFTKSCRVGIDSKASRLRAKSASRAPSLVLGTLKTGRLVEALALTSQFAKADLFVMIQAYIRIKLLDRHSPRRPPPVAHE